MATEIYDVGIIGGGINGCGIARDAAGRELSVFLAEKVMAKLKPYCAQLSKA